MIHFGCRGVTKNYHGQPVVQGIDLDIAKGELVCLLGPSGCGKTTLMNALSGVDQPDEGQVLLDGVDITGQPGLVSYMLQKDLLLPYKTVLDNVSLPLLLSGTPRKQARQQAETYLEAFGLSGHQHKYPQQLSGGMRQRAALLRTHLVGNDVLLLDEPFSALDAITKAQMHRWYLDIVAELGSTTLLITHDIDEALFLSDKIYILAGVPGQIVQEIQMQTPRPRTAEFSFSEEFLRQKQQILSAIGS